MPPPADTDVAILGAGPAGIAAARSLCDTSLRVTLIDAGRPPAPRIESLPPTGIALAEALGLGPALRQAALGRAQAMRLLWHGGPQTRNFGAGDAPLLLDRVTLHAALRAPLLHTPLLHTRVTGVEDRGDLVHLRHQGGRLTARFVIDARGRSALRAPRSGAGGQVALGFAARFGAVPDQPALLLQMLDAGRHPTWLWACLLPDHRLSGALFLPARLLAGLDAPGRERCLWRHLHRSALGQAAGMLGDLQAGAVEPATLRAARDPFASPLVLRIGDAALSRDPIASHGLIHALRSAAQGAAAAATILDPSGQPDAARAFVRDRHATATREARIATARALGGWGGPSPDSGTDPEAAPAPAPWPSLTRPLALSDLRPAATLDRGRIRWTPAIWLAHPAQAVTRLGPMAATDLARLLGPPAPVATLTRRLEAALDPALARSILRHLLDQGALTEPASSRA